MLCKKENDTKRSIDCQCGLAQIVKDPDERPLPHYGQGFEFPEAT